MNEPYRHMLERNADGRSNYRVQGAMIARIGNSPASYVGDLNTVRAPASGRLYLGVSDGELGNNSGDFQVVAAVQP